MQGIIKWKNRTSRMTKKNFHTMCQKQITKKISSCRYPYHNPCLSVAVKYTTSISLFYLFNTIKPVTLSFQNPIGPKTQAGPPDFSGGPAAFLLLSLAREALGNSPQGARRPFLGETRHSSRAEHNHANQRDCSALTHLMYTPNLNTFIFSEMKSGIFGIGKSRGQLQFSYEETFFF
jgi:hypothetical protein